MHATGAIDFLSLFTFSNRKGRGVGPRPHNPAIWLRKSVAASRRCSARSGEHVLLRSRDVTTPSRSAAPELQTERLVLRAPSQADLGFLAGINQDPEVMKFMPGLMSVDDTRRQLEGMLQHFRDHGFGVWVAVRKGTDDCVGIVGLKRVDLDVPFAPSVEIAWRLARSQWGKGYAAEAACEVLRFGFERLALEQIVGFTVPRNRRSIAVFERLRMRPDPAFDFEHPKLPAGHELRPHVFYRIERAEMPRS